MQNGSVPVEGEDFAEGRDVIVFKVLINTLSAILF